MHYYLHLNLVGMLLRSHSVCGMLIPSLTGNRIQCTPKILFNYILLYPLIPVFIHFSLKLVPAYPIFPSTRTCIGALKIIQRYVRSNERNTYVLRRIDIWVKD